MYPEMLNVEDFQKDTPLFIALKEASYFLLKYSDQLDGYLADETSYDDEDYDEYYPEIAENREAVLKNGEWVSELAQDTSLTLLN